MNTISQNFQYLILLCSLFFVSNVINSKNIMESNISEQKYDSLASLFYKSEMVCEYDSAAEQQIKSYVSRSLDSFSQYHEYTINQDPYHETSIEKILIIVKNNIYSSIPTYIIRYAHDIHNAFGCRVSIVSVDGETPPKIRAIIKAYSTNLNGVVLIGDIAPAIYYHSATSTGNTTWEEDYFPCDLYYMDLDGTWHLKGDGSGWYNEHTGDVRPEIFVGRINTATMGRNEITELKYYFDKNHQYWTGQKVLNKKRALTFTGPDWNNANFRESVEPLYGVNFYDEVSGAGFTCSNYINYLQNNVYEFIQLACHSDAHYHEFTSHLYYYSISSLATKQIGYNLFCCHACNWMSYSGSQCLGESYLYGQSNNSSALALVGSTKTGCMLGFDDFYEPLGDGLPIGTAFYHWWCSHCGSTHSLSEKLWFYGMTILGDPLINFNYTNECDNILFINTGEETDNNMYYSQSEIIVQNYSITQEQNVSLSAPTIRIIGNFRCSSPSTLSTNINDKCVCPLNRNRDNTIETFAPEKILTSLKEVNKSPYFLVYPNPVKDILNIELIAKVKQLFLYTQQGQCVISTSTTSIEVSHLPSGIYIVKAFTEEGNIYQSKIIVQH